MYQHDDIARADRLAALIDAERSQEELEELLEEQPGRLRLTIEPPSDEEPEQDPGASR